MVSLQNRQSLVLQSNNQGINYFNQLEPTLLIESFLSMPPIGFLPLHIGSSLTPAFVAPFDILTTLDDSHQWFSKVIRSHKWLHSLVKLKTVFVGTTVSEYFVFKTFDYSLLITDLIKQMYEQQAELLIIKDIPFTSPLLTFEEADINNKLLEQCNDQNFQILSGQALAYVPIDFESIEEFLDRMSSSRRKDLRRKLRISSSIEIKELKTGDTSFENDIFVRELYQLYLNVYEQSKYHFDQLTYTFFKSVLLDKHNNGLAILYSRQDQLIGFNLCFVHNNNLVDKYVGFRYPQAREANLYFISWFYNLEYALKHRLNHYIAGWTDPEVKASLGAKFTFTYHAVYCKNLILRTVLNKLKRFFEADQNWALKEHCK